VDMFHDGHHFHMGNGTPQRSPAWLETGDPATCPNDVLALTLSAIAPELVLAWALKVRSEAGCRNL